MALLTFLHLVRLFKDWSRSQVISSFPSHTIRDNIWANHDVFVSTVGLSKSYTLVGLGNINSSPYSSASQKCNRNLKIFPRSKISGRFCSF